ncbi:MAG: NADP oxidoreductase, partial [Gammaproteobacteria bacterium]
VVFTFLKSPREIIGRDRVEKIILEHNTLAGDPFAQSARGTGQTTEIPAGLVFRSIGYRGVPIPGVPFDERNGIIPNESGRVRGNGSVVPQLYATGWIKRGPTGIIGTNRADSVATVLSLLADLPRLPSAPEKRGAEGICEHLTRRGIRYVTFREWKRIDEAEIERGRSSSKPREKFTCVTDMLAQLD